MPFLDSGDSLEVTYDLAPRNSKKVREFRARGKGPGAKTLPRAENRKKRSFKLGAMA